MGDLFHEGVRIIVSRLLSAGAVHNGIRVKDIEFDDEVSHDF